MQNRVIVFLVINPSATQVGLSALTCSVDRYFVFCSRGISVNSFFMLESLSLMSAIGMVTGSCSGRLLLSHRSTRHYCCYVVCCRLLPLALPVCSHPINLPLRVHFGWFRGRLLESRKVPLNKMYYCYYYYISGK